MSRLFTFGCSFTQFDKWPTWADILGKEYSQFENWGKIGGGNLFIFNSLIECIARNQITNDDTIIVMWTSIGREDRWVSTRGWVTPGSIYNQIEYDAKFVSKWADPAGYLIRDLAFVSAARKILEAIGCKWEFLSIVPLEYYDDSCDFKNDFLVEQNLKLLYNSDIQLIKPSVYEVVFNFNWYSRPGEVNISLIEQKYEILKGVDWPTWEQFVANDLTNVKNNIKQELKETIVRDFIRTDCHPTPVEHLSYINSVLPKYTISPETIKWVYDLEHKVNQGEKITWNRSLPRIRI